MKLISLATGVVSLLSASSLFAQNSLVESSAVSIYQLRHKTAKQARLLFAKGSHELQQQHYQSSVQLFQRAIDVDPQYWAAQNNMGYAYLKLDQLESAEHAFERAIEIDPGNPIGHTNLGIYALNGNNYAMAEQCANRALRLQPSLQEAKALLGIAKIGQGQWTPEARKLLEETRASVPAADALVRKWPLPSHLSQTKLVVVAASASVH